VEEVLWRNMERGQGTWSNALIQLPARLHGKLAVLSQEYHLELDTCGGYAAPGPVSTHTKTIHFKPRFLLRTQSAFSESVKVVLLAALGGRHCVDRAYRATYFQV